MRTFYIILVITLAFTACKKERALNKVEENIIGVWELRKTIGESGLKWYQPGNKNIRKFTNSGGLEISRNDTVTFTGNYYFKYEKDCDDQHKVFLYTNETVDRSYLAIKVQANEMELSTSACVMDGGVSTWVKIQ